MTRRLLSFLLIMVAVFPAVWGQVTILDFESAATTTTFQYFGSSLEPSLTSTIANPDASGDNTSATVLQFAKPAACQTWAGAYSNPNPTTPVDVTSSTHITVKVWMDHIGNLGLKLENSSTGGANWLQTKANTKINQWETLTFDVTIPGEETPNTAAAGNVYNTVTLFFDFGTSPAADLTYYLDDIVVEPSSVLTCNTFLDFETAPTTTTFQFFGSTIDGQLSTTIANPDASGINTSANVLNFLKPANCQTWAGAFSNPDPAVPIDVTGGGMICLKFWTDHPGNVYLKLENSLTGGANWAMQVDNTVVNEWVELCFDTSLPSLEAPNQPAAGNVYARVTLFCDFGTSPTSDQVFYIDDLSLCTSGSTPTAAVTFKVDMNQYTGTYSNVYVSGSFNSWSGDANPMSDPDGDKVYETTLQIPVGLYEYKFELDNWANSESFPVTASCTKTTIDGSNVFTNRKLALAGDATVGPYCYSSCYSCGNEVNITFNLGMGTYTADPGGVYLAGGLDFGAPGGLFRMSDDNGDQIYNLTIQRERNYSSFYDFANGPCPDYSCKEHIEGQPCARPDNYNDRFLNPVSQDTVINTCFAVCSDNTACTISDVKDLSAQSGWMTLQPSLATSSVYLGFASSCNGAAQIRVFNAAGIEVMHLTSAPFADGYQLQVNQLQKGMYFVEVKTNDKQATAKFVRM